MSNANASGAPDAAELPTEELLTSDLHQFAKYYEEFLRTGATGATSTYTHLDKVDRKGLAAPLPSFGIGFEDAVERDAIHLSLRPPDSVEIDASDDSEDGAEDRAEDADEDQTADLRDENNDGSTEGDLERLSKAARSIFRRQQRDPHNRETLLGLGAIGRRTSRGIRVGPLLYWEVTLKYDAAQQRLSVFKRSSQPEINTLILDQFLEDHQDIEAVLSDMIAALSTEEGGLMPSTIDKLFRIVAGHSPDPRALESSLSTDTNMREWFKLLRRLGQGYWRSAFIANGPRSHAFLLRDLRKLLDADLAQGESALASLLSRDPPRKLEGLETPPFSFSESADGKAPLYFPLQSNPAQRSVARKMEKADILTVQGPPGTGKSLTIANLVAHLVASGRSVLVTSHQRKAIEVVAKHLSPLKDLALPLVEGDRESVAKLKSQLEALLEGSRPSLAKARGDVRQGEEALDELDRSLRRLAYRFQELRQTEHENFTEVRKYADLRELDVINVEDIVSSASSDEIEAALPRWIDLYLAIGPEQDRLNTLLRPLGETTTRVRETRVASAISRLAEFGEALLDGPIPEEVGQTRDWLSKRMNSPAEATRYLEALVTWLGSEGQVLVHSFEQLATPNLSRPDALVSWEGAARAIGTEDLARMAEQTRRHQEWFEEQSARYGTPERLTAVDRATVSGHLKILETKGESWWRWWVDPSVRLARRELQSYGIERRASLASDLDRLGHRVEWSGRLDRLETIRDAISQPMASHGLTLSDDLSPDRLSRYLHRCLAVLSLLESAPAHALEAISKRATPHAKSCTREWAASLVEHARAVIDEVGRTEWIARFREDVPRGPSWDARLTGLADAVAGGEQLHGSARDTATELLELRSLFDPFIEMTDLQQGTLLPIQHTLDDLREQLTTSGSRPAWTNKISDVLDAHRLGALLRGSLSADPDDITDIARRLREGEGRRRSFITEIVQRRRILNQTQALEEPARRQELLKLRRLLGSRRLTNSLISLRDQIDYRSLLTAVPAWVCTIDDAARLFPPLAGLFDVVIIDEASQCPQTVLMPLALRARKMVVVGDENQLQPTFGRFIPRSQVEALKQKYRINTHPMGMFVEGHSSLLQATDYRANTSEFLNEHFRCEPPIIAWSNDQFYHNRLRILTHRRGGGFGPAISNRLLADADEDRDQSVNPVEAKAVVREVRRLIEATRSPDMTIGVISPFRPQADLIQGLLEREFRSDPEKLSKHQIVASTADGFQGDERDIILYSFRQGPSSTPASIRPLDRQPERFNVAFTRARRMTINFLSTTVDRLPEGSRIRSWMNHSLMVENGEFGTAGPAGEDHFDSEFERDVCGRLRDRGLNVTTQVPCGPFRIDLVAKDSAGRVLAVECDGSWKHDQFGNLRPEDYQRQDLIERAGWVVHRVSGRRYLLDPVREIDRICEVLSERSTEEEQAILEGMAEDFAGAVDELREADSTPSPAAVEDEEETAPPSPQVDTDQSANRDVPQAQAARATERLELSLSEQEEIRRLIRWSLLQSRVRGRMFDTLMDMAERLDAMGHLERRDQRHLSLIRADAEREGFDPSRDPFLN